MLVPLKDRLDNREVAELVSYAVYPDAQALQKSLDAYKQQDDLELLGLDSEGDLVGVIGVRSAEAGEMTILHLAVKPEFRGHGFGRGILLELIDEKKPSVLHAETDEDAVEFYRSVGFIITSLGEKYPGVERFHCVYEVEQDEEE